MATTRQLQQMHETLAFELDGFGLSLASLREGQENLASWVANLVKLLADAGVISRTEGPFAGLFPRPNDVCLFCQVEH